MRLLILSLIFALAFAGTTTITRNFCPAHKSTLYRSDEGGSYSVVEPCDSSDLPLPLSPPTPENGDPISVLPEYVGNFVVGKAIPWKGHCFRKNTGSITVDQKGFTIQVDLADPKSFLCNELIIVATPSRFIFHDFLNRGHHEIRVNGWDSQDEFYQVSHLGVPVLVFQEGIIKTLMDAYSFYKTFIRINNATETELVAFHKSNLNYVFKPRTRGLLDIKESEVRSGDCFALHITTPHETYDWLLTGSHSGHVAIALRVNGKAYVFETTDATFFPPPYGFHMTPFEEWKKIYADQGYEIAWMRIRKDLGAIMERNAQKAYSWFEAHSMEFICPSFGFTAFDTKEDNFPPPLSSDSFFTLVTIFDKYQHPLIQFQVLESINMRFNKYYHALPCDDMKCAQIRAFELNTTLGDILALPEIDGWLYAKGPSIVCAGVVAHMLREGGVLAPYNFNAGEFDPKDVYELDIFDHEWLDRPAACWGSTQLPNEVPYCQLAGHWAIELPNYSSYKPHDHMNDHCGGMPPSYARFPANC